VKRTTTIGSLTLVIQVHVREKAVIKEEADDELDRGERPGKPKQEKGQGKE